MLWPASELHLGSLGVSLFSCVLNAVLPQRETERERGRERGRGGGGKKIWGRKGQRKERNKRGERSLFIIHPQLRSRECWLGRQNTVLLFLITHISMEIRDFRVNFFNGLHLQSCNEKTGFISLDSQLFRHGPIARMKTLLGGPSYCSWSFGLLGHVSQHQLLAKAGGVNHSTYSGMSQSAFSWAQVMHNGINQPKMEKPNISHHGGKYTLQVGCQAAISISLPISKDTSIPDARWETRRRCRHDI